jgi:hypothetical protein
LTPVLNEPSLRGLAHRTAAPADSHGATSDGRRNTDPSRRPASSRRFESPESRPDHRPSVEIGRTEHGAGGVRRRAPTTSSTIATYFTLPRLGVAEEAVPARYPTETARLPFGSCDPALRRCQVVFW